jgi:glycerophosphoryl diester phosphodiesterase
MAAFRKARDIGAPGIELDIHVCKTGELVVAHDDNFLRTVPEGPNSGGRPIEELEYAEIRAIDVGAAFGRQSGVQEARAAGAFRGERPPLLEQVLEEFCPGMYIDIELKTRKTKDDPLPVLAADMLKHFGDRVLKSVTVSSFNPFSILAFKKLCPLVPTAVIFCVDREVPPLLRYGFGRFISRCDYLKPIYRQVSRLAFFRFRTLEGRPLVPWTVDEKALAQGLLKTGCEGIISNRPQDLL